MNYEDAVAIRARRNRIAARDLIERGLHELRAAERGHVVAECLDSKPVECPSRLFIGMREILVELTIEFGACLLCFGNPLLDVRCHLTGAHRAGLHRALQALDCGYALLLACEHAFKLLVPITLVESDLIERLREVRQLNLKILDLSVISETRSLCLHPVDLLAIVCFLFCQIF